MTNYNKGKIYKIEPICDHEEGEVYIGSTTKDYLSQRMTWHRSDYKKWKNGTHGKVMVYDMFDKYGIENCQIILLESVNATTKDELNAREGYYVRTLKCVNKLIPDRSEKEYRKQYYENHRDEQIEYRKKYRVENQDLLRAKRIEYYYSNIH